MGGYTHQSASPIFPGKIQASGAHLPTAFNEDVCVSKHMFFLGGLPSLKLTVRTWNTGAWKMSFVLGPPAYFQVRLLLVSEGTSRKIKWTNNMSLLQRDNFFQKTSIIWTQPSIFRSQLRSFSGNKNPGVFFLLVKFYGQVERGRKSPPFNNKPKTCYLAKCNNISPT